MISPTSLLGFLASSAGKESTCSAEDPNSIPGSGRSPGEEIGYPLQYSWASLAAQMVKNQPTMWEIWVRFLEGHGNPLQDSCLENPYGQRSQAGYSPWGHRVRHNWVTKPKASFFFSPKMFLYWPHWVLVAVEDCGIFNLPCGIQDLVPWPGIEPRPPALGALDHQLSPSPMSLDSVLQPRSQQCLHTQTR